MSVLSLLLNIAWIVCGGLEMALAWLVASVIMAITIIGIPWAKAAFNIAFYTLALSIKSVLQWLLGHPTQGEQSEHAI